MFLDELIITDNIGNTIRSVKFKKGLNLIVGIGDDKGTTNSIGKTTLVRCIDFCLGGKIEQIYTDKEFKNNTNKAVCDFLEKNQPSFKLIVKDDLKDSQASYTISRSVTFNKKNQIKITDTITKNQENINFSDFNLELKNIFFQSNSLKPTFRELIAKFIRKDDQQVSNVLKYLSPYTSSSQYEKMHLFLFGFPRDGLLKEKNDVESKLKKNIEILNTLKSQFNIKDLVQILEIIKNDLEKSVKQRDEFKIDEKYEIEEKELSKIQLKLLNVEKKISDLQLKLTMSRQQLNNIQEGFFTQDTESLKLMYEEVRFYIDNLHKSFEDVVNFHNKMLENELNYTKRKLQEYNSHLNGLINLRQTYANRYSTLLEKLSKTGSLAEYTKLSETIERLSEKKGRVEQQIEDIRRHDTVCRNLHKQLEEIKDKIKQRLVSFDKKLALFNSFFAYYSKKLYDQEFFLSYKENKDIIEFSIKEMSGNEGSGKKQATISAFDLAYIDFTNEAQLNFPKFSAIDKIEVVDIEKLVQLFEIANNVNGQFIIPVIYDKIENIYHKYQKDKIIELSESNKFFKF